MTLDTELAIWRLARQTRKRLYPKAASFAGFMATVVTFSHFSDLLSNLESRLQNFQINISVLPLGLLTASPISTSHRPACAKIQKQISMQAPLVLPDCAR